MGCGSLLLVLATLFGSREMTPATQNRKAALIEKLRKVRKRPQAQQQRLVRERERQVQGAGCRIDGTGNDGRVAGWKLGANQVSVEGC